MLNHYRRNIRYFLTQNTNLPVKKEIDVELTFKYGRLKAIVQSASHKLEFDAYDLIR
jgi:hypothetical protein